MSFGYRDLEAKNVSGCGTTGANGTDYTVPLSNMAGFNTYQLNANNNNINTAANSAWNDNNNNNNINECIGGLGDTVKVTSQMEIKGGPLSATSQVDYGLYTLESTVAVNTQSNKSLPIVTSLTSSASGYECMSTAATVGVHVNSSSVLSQANSNSGANYLSDTETAILKSAVPMSINETEEITYNGIRGIWANKTEVTNWRGLLPIAQYEINQDPTPEIITKRTQELLTYIQEMAVYFRQKTRFSYFN
jgi:hypothetical protein